MSPLRLLSFSGCPTVPLVKSVLAAHGFGDIVEIDLETLPEGDPLRGYSSPTLLSGDSVIFGGNTSRKSLACTVLDPREIETAVASLKDREYWAGRWARRETGWHQATVEPALAAWFTGRSRRRIFVPLCGKSLDLKWLLDQGHEVIGCEFSPLACSEFFQEHGIPVQTSREGAFDVYRGPSLTLFCGDVFALTARELGVVDAVYDRAALIALRPELRKRYAPHLLEILGPSRKSPGFEFLQVVLERSPADETGPPFSIPASEVTKAYGAAFHISPVSRESVEANGPVGSRTEECVFLLRPQTLQD